MTKTAIKFSLSIFLALSILLLQFAAVYASPSTQDRAPVSGVVQTITLEANTVTGVTLVSVDVLDNNQVAQRVRVSLETAIAQGLVVLNGDGKPNINDSALGNFVEIEQASIIPEHAQTQHPIGSALATFFSSIPGIDYEVIMSAHEQGVGFGVLAQALWLTTKLEGGAEIFEALIEAKQTGDFSAFILEDGSTPKNWGQLRKAILSKGKEHSLGVVLSNSQDHGNGNDGVHGNGNDIGNSGGNGNGNSHGNGNGNGGGNDHGNGGDHGNGHENR